MPIYTIAEYWVKSAATGKVKRAIHKSAAALKAHSTSSAVKRFESVYRPILLSKGVKFTDYHLVAGKHG